LEDLRETWRHVVELDIRLEARETSPQLIQIVAPNEVVVLIVFEVRIGDISGMMNLCVPTSLLEPIAGKFDYELSAGTRREVDPQDIKKLKELLMNTRQSLSADIYGTRISIQDLISIERGDMLLLDFDNKSPVILSVGGVPKLKGNLVIKNQMFAYVVRNTLSEEDLR
jgi:flagellar motor switch protein FliM